MNKQLKLILITSSIIYAVLFSTASWAQTVLQEIQQTGVLKVGIRKDAVLFGYEDGQGWKGYCTTFADALANSLSRKLNRTVTVAAVRSTIQNREAIVRNGTVHIECGPNTISNAKEQVENIKYSQPFFITGTQLLVKNQNRNVNLSNTSIGVLQGSANLAAVARVYPRAEIVQFTERYLGITAVSNGKITAFAGDTVLLVGEAVRQGLPVDNFALLPSQPLSCDVYGMILPANDSQWQNSVNSFINSNEGKQAWATWFGGLVPYLKATIDYCNR
ncbi:MULTISPECIES: amino acid ABC transporter substrate-binding protein [unclassified Microcoleus]|uniref:amino acid ABC transporter substrate-binding protein n=1 Tax=unclassified Microcoleus TaxID=2642155 RepID=UPI002FD2A4F4